MVVQPKERVIGIKLAVVRRTILAQPPSLIPYPIQQQTRTTALTLTLIFSVQHFSCFTIFVLFVQHGTTLHLAVSRDEARVAPLHGRDSLRLHVTQQLRDKLDMRTEIRGRGRQDV